MNDSFNNKSRVDTLSATVIGFALTCFFNSYEQNALGNWFMLLGQILETNATFIQLYQSCAQNNSNRNVGLDIEKLKKAIDIIQDELDKMKK